MQVKKRNGTIEPYNETKLHSAVLRAVNAVTSKEDTKISKAITKVTESVQQGYESTPIPTSVVMHMVELQLMKVGLYELAKEFILFREQNKPDIFRKRENYKPFEYQHLADFRLAILNNFWLHTHFNYDSDIQDIMVNMPKEYAEMTKRAILAISNIEVKVKKFWGNIGNYFPKPEIEEVGAVFSCNEAIHAMAYSNLIEIMNLNDEFEKLKNVPAIQKRVSYLEKSISTPTDNSQVFKNIILFSMFIENVSLFSQFYFLLKMNKDNKWLKGTANAIFATSTEETLHAKFGFLLVNIIKEEHPEWFTDEVQLEVIQLAKEAVTAEESIIDWIVGDTDTDMANEMKFFMKSRMNASMSEIGIDPIYTIPDGYDFSWFDLLVSGTHAVDFFAAKSTAYSKGIQSFDADDLF